jgi:hypothetical protein
LTILVLAKWPSSDFRLTGRRFTLTQIVDALRYVDEGRATGKVVVTM